VAGASLNDITDEMFLDMLTGMPALNGLPVSVRLARRQGRAQPAESAAQGAAD
jgi:hypothetical protein